MWLLWSFVLCFLMTHGNADAREASATPGFAAPATADSQQQPQPRKEGAQERRRSHRRQPVRTRLGAEGEEEDQELKGPVGPDIELPTGPMRVELAGLVEVRTRFEHPGQEQALPAVLRLRLHLTGERLAQLVYLGNLVLGEVVDDAGEVLVDPEDVDLKQRSRFTPARPTRRTLARGYHGLMGECKLPSRAARKLTMVSGWVDAVYADETEDVMIDDPAQYTGGYIKHPRLEELGMKIKVIKPGKEVDPRRDGRGLALQYESGRVSVRKVDLYDAWMRPISARELEKETADGEPYNFYSVDVGSVNEDTLLILRIYPKIDEERIRFKFEDVELP